MNFSSIKLRPNIKNMNVEKMCRICLVNTNRLKNIYQGRICRMIETCSCVRIVEGDGLPSNICVTCFYKITKLYSFKRKIEYNDRYLRKIIKNKIDRRDILNVALTEANINNRSINGEVREEDIPLSERLTGSEKELETHKSEPPPLVPIIFDIKSGAVENIDLPPLIPINPGVNINTLENIVPITENHDLHCKHCDEKFDEMTLFNEHKLKSCKENLLQCNICKKDFLDKAKLIRHLKGHMIVKSYCCKLCNKQYPNASRFRNHLLSHKGERPFCCPTCNKGFITRGGLDRHLKTHGESRPYICNICGRSFKVPEYLEKHKKLHADIKPFSCTVCDKQFSQSQHLEVHNLTYHTHERPYLCNICGKGFVSSPRLKRHMGVHTGFKPFACQYCTKTYTTSKNLKIHEQHHLNGDSSDRNFCNICNRKFSHSWRLAKHKKIHEGMYQCQICSKSYCSENILNKHLITHGYMDDMTVVTEDTSNINV